MKKITFTKEQRNAIYIKALERYSISTNKDVIGLCWFISYAAEIITNCSDLIAYGKGMKIHFPEVYKHRPKGARTDWFSHSTRGINKRIAILNQAIKETM